MGEANLSVTAKIPGSESEYSLELDLAHPIKPLESSYKIMSTKIEIKLQKVTHLKILNRGLVIHIWWERDQYQF